METDERFLIYNEERLKHCVEADDTKPFIIFETVMRSKGNESPIPVEVEAGRIEDTRILKRLKAKGRFSLWDDFSKDHAVYVAERIIFRSENNS